MREIVGAVIAAAAIVVGATFAVLLPSAPAHAGGGLGGGISNNASPAFNQAAVVSDITFTPSSTGGLNIRNGSASYLNIGSAGTGYFAVVPTEPRVRATNGSSVQIDAFIEPVGAALTIGNPTDTTTAPSRSDLRISAAAAAAWTPSETGARDGQTVTAVNTGAFAITMTDAAAVYEGGAAACVLGQWDAVEFRYTSDRWVEIACRDN